MSKVTQADIVKAKLRPELDQPYFEVSSEFEALTTKRCMHIEHGVRLDKIDRRCYCRGCGIMVDPFEALLYYASAERRLVSTREQIQQHVEAEQRKKQREKERRPYKRRVVSTAPVYENDQGIEVVVGHLLTLECGHTRNWTNPRTPEHATCEECQKTGKRK